MKKNEKQDLSEALAGIGKYLDNRFDAIDYRFEQVDKRFDWIEHRLDQQGALIETYLKKADVSLEAIANVNQKMFEVYGVLPQVGRLDKEVNLLTSAFKDHLKNHH